MIIIYLKLILSFSHSLNHSIKILFMPQFDFLVIGSGIAGLSYAAKLARHFEGNQEISIAVITKVQADETNTKYAQGGLRRYGPRGIPSKNTLTIPWTPATASISATSLRL